MPKQNKIIAIISTDDMERRRMIQQMLVKMGLAITPGDAAKLIRPTTDDYDLPNAYLVAVGKYNLGTNNLTTHQLYRLATQGVAVVVGMTKMKREYEFMCDTYYNM